MPRGVFESMRLIKALVTGIVTLAAVMAALAVAALATLTGLILYLVRKGRPLTAPPPPSGPVRMRRGAVHPGEVIDITATEVSVQPPSK